MDTYAFDEEPGLLIVTIRGMFTMETAAAFAQELGARVATAMERGDDTRILIDSSEAPVQQSASFTEISKVGQLFPKPLPTAIVTGSMLAKMQADRGVTDDLVRTFMSRDEALAWLRTV